MAEKHSSPPPPTDPEDMSCSETESELQGESTSSSSEEATGSKEISDSDVKMVDVSSKPEAASSSDSNQSASSASFSAVLTDKNTALPSSTKSSLPTFIPSCAEFTGLQSSQRPTSLPSSSKAAASPMRSRSDQPFIVFKEIKRMSKEKSRAKQLRKIVRNFFTSNPVEAMMESQTIRSPASETPGLQFPDMTCLKKDQAAESSASASSHAASDSQARFNREETEQYVGERENNLTEILDELQSLRDLVRRRNFFDTEAPGPSRRSPSEEETVLDRLIRRILENMQQMQDLAEAMRSWTLDDRQTIDELRLYMNRLNDLQITTEESISVQRLLRSWERSVGPAAAFGDATSVLQVENRLHSIHKALVAECHLMHYHYWLDKWKNYS